MTSHAWSEAVAYEQWAEYYDLARPDIRPYLSFYSSLVTKEMRSIVELGCGTGLVISELHSQLQSIAARKTVRCVGIDGSPDMLRIARRRNSNVEWHLADLRALSPFYAFDFAFCCYNTLQNFDRIGLIAALSGARTLVRPGGLFAIDIYQPNFEYLAGISPDALKIRHLIDRNGRPLELHERLTFEGSQNLLIIDWELLQAERGESLAKLSDRAWQHTWDVMGEALRRAGFGIKRIYGDLDRSCFDQRSKKQVIVCTAQ